MKRKPETENRKPSEVELMKRALGELRELRERVREYEKAFTEPVAVTGLACRLPGGIVTADGYWELLKNGVDGIGEVPPDRWDLEAWYDPHPDAPGKMYCRYGGFLEGVDRFDAAFFGISPREAARLDPQQRLLLETVWEALENGCYPPDRLYGSPVGVFMGISGFDYAALQLGEGAAESLDAYLGTGMALSAAAGRISYLLGLTGPSLAVETACSSSLTAVHLACQSLRRKECDMALAGGVNLMLVPELTVNFCKARMLSPDGRCKTFDASADGYVRGEGCGVVVLKRLSDALAHGDPVRALVRGSAANQDGSSGGLTVPSGPSQEAVIRQALESCKVDPRHIDYLEAHGTGTRLGDPIEANAAAKVLGGPSRERPLLVGSVKTNLGHLEAASGIASLVKVVLSLENEAIPPHLHFKDPSPHIAWEEGRLEVPTRLLPWPRGQKPRLAGVSSFGFAGSNAHVVLEEAPEGQGGRRKADAGGSPGVRPQYAAGGERQPTHRDIPPPTAYGLQPTAYYLLPLSAKTPEALRELARKYIEHLRNHPDLRAGDACFSAAAGRCHFRHRAAVCGRDLSELVDGLRRVVFEEALESPLDQGKVKTDFETASKSSAPVFFFTGQGAQYPGMGRVLYETRQVFREAMDECADILAGELDRPLADVLYGSDAGLADPLRQTAYTQPALFALETSLARLWASWGVLPSAVMGHSVGEYAAAWQAGVLGLEDGLRLVAARGRLMQALPADGAMVSFAAEERQVREALGPFADRASVAAVNGPKSVVISGERRGVEAVRSQLEARGIKSKTLDVSHPFHSPLVEPALEAFAEEARKVRYRPPRSPIVSNVTGSFAGEEMARPEYWVEHSRKTVLFARSVETLHEAGYGAFLEIGPAPVLLGMAGLCLAGKEGGEEGLRLPSLRPDRDDEEVVLESLARLYVHGADVRWEDFHASRSPDSDTGETSRLKVPLPTYPFQRKRFWFPRRTEERPRPRAREDGKGIDLASVLVPGVRRHPLLGERLDSPLEAVQFHSVLAPDGPPFLDDHRMGGHVVFPAAGFVEMALAAGTLVLGDGDLAVEEVEVLRPLVFGDGEGEGASSLAVRSVLTPEEACSAAPSARGSYAFRIHSRPGRRDRDEEGSPWKLHVQGELKSLEREASPSSPVSAESLRASFTEILSVEEHYRGFREKGMEYGPALQSVVELRRREGQVLARLKLPSLSGENEAERGEGASLPGPVGKSPFHMDYLLHPVLLDGCFQALQAVLSAGSAQDRRMLLPVGVDRMRFHSCQGEDGPSSRAPTELWVQGWVQALASEGRPGKASLRISDGEGKIVAEVEGLRFLPADAKALLRDFRRTAGRRLYGTTWKAREIPDQAEPAWCLLRDDGGGIGERLAEELGSKGHFPVLAPPGTPVAQWGTEAPRPQRKLPMHAIYLPAFGFSPLRERESLSGEDMLKAVASPCMELVRLVRELAHAGLERPPRLWVVAPHCSRDLEGSADDRKTGAGTRRPAAGLAETSLPHRPPFSDHRPLSPEISALGGLCRTIALEHPELRCTFLHADAESPAELAGILSRELSASEGENEIAWVQGSRRLLRLRPLDKKSGDARPARAGSPSASPFQVKLSGYGSLENLAIQTGWRRPPGPGEVEIQVRAAGLNFRDVLNALGMLEEHARSLGIHEAGDMPFGFECAGTVTRAGEGAPRWKPGDEVLAAPIQGAFAGYATVPGNRVGPKPPSWSFEEAAAFPLAFLTAWYGLRRLASLQPGERVLVHAAAGGVGLAAVQIARRAGAEVLGTASPEKWDVLKACGVRHAMHSRKRGFAKEVMEITQGRGVDVVLNSLAGEFIPDSLDVLAEGGRFVEIGKLGIWSAERVKERRPDIAYFPFDLGEAAAEDPALVPSMLDELLEEIRQGRLSPPRHRVFPVSEVREAFRFMARARHTGKIVLSMEKPQVEESDAEVALENNDESSASFQDSAPESSFPQKLEPTRTTKRQGNLRSPNAFRFDPDATYLVTGGLGGLGLLTARWMVDRGARSLALTGRPHADEKDPASRLNDFSLPTAHRLLPSQQKAIGSMEEAGARVEILRADVASEEQMRSCLEDMASRLPVLKGVVHAAGILDDCTIKDLTEERLQKVLAPKVAGAWNLHRLTRDLDLDFFVLFSSATSVLGNGGQGNYAAANGFLDGLAHYRRAAGLKATSIDWGPWRNVGMTAAKSGTASSFDPTGSSSTGRDTGIHPMPPGEALELLGEILHRDLAQACVLHADWKRFAERCPPEARGLLEDLAPREELSQDKGPKELPEMAARLEKAPPEGRQGILADMVRETARKVLGLREGEPLAWDQPLAEQGFDSLMAVELRNLLARGTGRPLSVDLLFNHPTVQDIAGYLRSEVLGEFFPQEGKGKPTESISAPDAGRDEMAYVDDLDQDELEELIRKELQT